ncbi:hypothetical protein V6N11_028801 [Hibiscus sabdariffa]|uniref:Uncharacterized protein n=1 Tax=Hibiscus sabdariffa TaxID=183260 RepID=A0ABR2PR87_9ROSI
MGSSNETSTSFVSGALSVIPSASVGPQVHVPQSSGLAADNESHDANSADQQLAVGTQESLEGALAEEVAQDEVSNAFSPVASNEDAIRTEQEDQVEDEDIAGLNLDRVEEEVTITQKFPEMGGRTFVKH